MKRRTGTVHSTRLLAAVSLILLITVLDGGFISYAYNSISNDAWLINHAGIVRGGMQRVFLLALTGEDFSAVQKTVHDRITSLHTLHRPLMRGEQGALAAQTLDQLYPLWLTTVPVLAAHQHAPSEHTRTALLERSGQCWLLSNRMLGYLETANERKLQLFWLTFVLTGINIAVVLLVLLLIRSYVRQRLEIQASRDQLTGIFNRRMYQDILPMEIRNAQRQGVRLTLLIFDIDHFKKVNDTHGHRAGDAVLKKVCDVVASHMRRADYFFRIGGEEFVILALHTGADGGHNLAEKMRESIAGTHIGAIDGAVTVSFGLAELGAADDDETLFRRADAALYQAKHLGRNRVVMAGTEN